MKLIFLVFVFLLCVIGCWAPFSNNDHGYSEYGESNGYNQWRPSDDDNKYSQKDYHYGPTRINKCSDGKNLYCWKCDDTLTYSDCQNNGQWEKCGERESCFYEQSVEAKHSSYSYEAHYITKLSRGCMNTSTCKAGKSLCKGYVQENCRECGLGCWYKCEHPPCPRRVQCRKCGGTKTEEECVERDEYRTCPRYIKDPVCEERLKYTYNDGSRFFSRCVERKSCLGNQKGYNSDYNSGYKKVECKQPYCPKPEPTTTSTPKPTTSTTTSKPTTLPCPGPGEEILDYEDRKRMIVNLEDPVNDSDDPNNFLQGFPRDDNGMPEPLFFTKTGDKETFVTIDFTKREGHNIKKIYVETKQAKWVRVKLFKGNELQQEVKIPPSKIEGSPWEAHEMEVDGEGITRMEITFGYETGELRAKGAFFIDCP